MRTIFYTLLMLSFSLSANAQVWDNFSISAHYGVGYDLSTSSDDYNISGPFYIPSDIESSIVRIQTPLRYGIGMDYGLNAHLSFGLGYGRTTRALRYWSLNETLIEETCIDCKLDLGIAQNNIRARVKFATDTESKLNFHLSTGLGISWMRHSLKHGLTAQDSQAEVLLTNDVEYSLLQVYNNGRGPKSFGSLTALGINYELTSKLFLEVELAFDHEFVNKSELIIHSYDPDTDQTLGQYSPYDLEFKSLYTMLGLRYRL
jgi:hypothetical protein